MGTLKTQDAAVPAHSHHLDTINRQTVSSAEMSGQTDLQRNLPVFLTPSEVAERWRVSVRTLERWRLGGTGPSWISIGGGIRYPLDAIHSHEQRQRLVPARAVGGNHDLD